MTFRSFVENPKKVSYFGIDKDEKIIYVLRSSFIMNIPWMLLSVLLIIAPSIVLPYLPDSVSLEFKFVLIVFWYLFTFGYIFREFLGWFFNVYIISNKKIVDVDFYGLLYTNISEAPLENVEDVTSQISGSVGVIFNIGNVEIQTAGEKREFEFTNIADPAKIRDLISDLVAAKKHKKRKVKK